VSVKLTEEGLVIVTETMVCTILPGGFVEKPTRYCQWILGTGRLAGYITFSKLIEPVQLAARGKEHGEPSFAMIVGHGALFSE